MAKSQAQEMQNDDDREQVNENDSPLSEEERRRIDKVRSHSKAENTRAAYTEWWNRFQRWLEGRGDGYRITNRRRTRGPIPRGA